jgi:hypothetical protein
MDSDWEAEDIGRLLEKEFPRVYRKGTLRGEEVF